MVAGFVALLACGGALRTIGPPPAPTVATASTPSRARYWFTVAQVRAARHDLAGAREAIVTACLHDPTSGWLILEDARLMALQDASRGAVALRLEAALALDPGLGPAWVALGDARQDSGDVAGALEAWRAGVEARAGHAAWAPLAEQLLAGDSAEAVVVIAGWSALPAEGADAARRGRARAQVGDHAGAVEDLAAALAETPGDERLLDTLVAAASACGRYRTALVAMEAALARAPEAVSGPMEALARRAGGPARRALALRAVGRPVPDDALRAASELRRRGGPSAEARARATRALRAFGADPALLAAAVEAGAADAALLAAASDPLALADTMLAAGRDAGAVLGSLPADAALGRRALARAPAAEACAEARAAVARAPRDTAGALALATCARAGLAEPAEAVAALQAAWDGAPADARVMTALAHAAAAAGRTELAAMVQAEAAREAQGDAVFVAETGER